MLRSPDQQKLEQALKRHHELQSLIADPLVINDPKRFQLLAKEYSDLEPLAATGGSYLEMSRQLQDALAMASKESDPELRLMAEAEVQELQGRIPAVEEKLQLLINPPKEEKDRDIIIEIRAGTGGMEAGLFAADLYRMYGKYAATKGWSIDPISLSETEKGGIKEVIFSMSGKGCWKHMRFESGTHRVQRVPETEASGRIHTSAATVAVLPEPEDVDIVIDPKDLKIDVYRSSGPGGQSVNTADSAVRITHLPSGVVVVCQDERSQIKNKAKGMRVLRARLSDLQKQQQFQKESAMRKSQVGSGDRSEKIRTYNFPDHRVTDHRIGLTIHQLPAVMEGDLEELTTALIQADLNPSDD